MSTAQDELSATRYESRKQSIDVLKERLKQVQEMNEMMKCNLEMQLMEPDAKKRRLLKDLKAETDEKMKIFEELKRVEEEMRITDEELLVVQKEAQEEVKKMEDKYEELAERYGAVELSYSYVNSLFGQGENTVDVHVTDVIEISDDSDACCGPTYSQVQPSPSSSSSSSSEEDFVLVRLPVKKFTG